MPDPTTLTMTRSTTSDPWVYGPIEITEAGNTKTYTFKTQNKFLDGDIAISAHAAAVGALSLTIDDLTSNVTMGSPSDGEYSPSVSLVGHVSASSAGWMTTNSVTVTDSSVAIGKITQSTMKLGSASAITGTTITATPAISAQTVTISLGYNAARTVTIKAMSAGQKATVKSGTASLTGNLAFTYNSTSNNFTMNATANVTEPTVTTAGFISSSTGTKNANNSLSVSAVVGIVEVGAEQVGNTPAILPVIKRTEKSGGNWIDASSGSETDTPILDRPFVLVDVDAITGSTINVKGKVTSAGYGTTDYYDTTSNLSITINTSSATTMYVPIKMGTIKLPTVTPSFTSITYDTSTSKFKIGTNAITLTANTSTVITSEGYISTTAGTKTNGTVKANSTNINKIGLGVDVSTASVSITPAIYSATKGASTKDWIDGFGGSAAGAATTTEPTNGKPYLKITTTAASSSVTSIAKVTSAGYGTSTTYTAAAASEISIAVNAATVSYIPIKEAATFSLSIANNTGISGNSELVVGGLSNGFYSVTANNLSVTGTFSATTYGWLDSSKIVNDSEVDGVKVGKIAKATFTATGNKVVCDSAGYITAGDTALGTITAGTITAVSTDPGSSFTNNTAVVIPSGGWLKIGAGYYNNTKISLATLVPNSANIVVVSGTSNLMLAGVTAYDVDGALVTGTIETYGGLIEIA